MAKISLRVYDREIEGMIESGQLDEAVAHCQHILKTFSMHIETYQLLGKSFLEGRHFTDAADIFQRVLNAVPDDFVAHVGMSIIRDDEGKLDESIWHMERGFEVQPSNPAIQGELRRLYGRRDGVEPPKIRLSRDALANMYAQGELFNQAIAEIRAVLADDPGRPDLQVMLARAYFHAGQKVDAAEMAAQLLKKYPYCLDALRVLVEVLPGSSRAENTQVYRQRLRLLDPYSSFVSGSVFSSEQVADSTVNLERLEYQPGQQVTASQPTWAASLGVKLEDEKHATPAPTWLSSGETGAPEPSKATVPDGETSEPGNPPVIPDFLREAGWNESDGQASEMAPGLEAEPQEGEIVPGELPDWLKSQAPPEVIGATKPLEGPPTIAGADFPDWLAGLDEAAGVAAGIGVLGEVATGQPPAEEKQIVSAEVPAPSDQPTDVSPTPSETPDDGKDIPDWLSGLAGSEDKTAILPPLDAGAGDLQNDVLGAETAEAGAAHAGSDQVPDWLADLGSVAADNEKSTDAVPNDTGFPLVQADANAIDGTPEALVAEAATIPDWLAGLGNAAADEQKPAEAFPGDTGFPPIQADLTAPGGIAEQPAPSEVSELPDWLAEPGEPADTSTEATELLKPVVESVMPETGVEEKPADEETPAVSADFPDWLTGLAPAEAQAGDGVPAGELPEILASEAQPVSSEAIQDADIETSPDDKLPDWLTTPATETGVQEANASEVGSSEVDSLSENAPPAQQPTGGAPLDLQAGEAQSSTEQNVESLRPVGIEDDTMAWLEGLAAKQGAKPEELLTKPEDRSDQLPDWLKDSVEEDTRPAALAPEPEEKPEEATSQPVVEQPGIAPVETRPLPDLRGIQHLREDPRPEPASAYGTSEIQGAKPLGIEDDTMAWLEGLAAKQGAKPEELLTKPEDRSDVLPAWLEETTKAADLPKLDQTLQEPPVEAVQANPLIISPENSSEDVEMPLETSATGVDLVVDSVSEKKPIASADEESNITSWLKVLDAPATPQEPASEPHADEQAIARNSDMPEWLKEYEKKPAPINDENQGGESPELPDWLLHANMPPAVVTASEPAQVVDELPDWPQDDTAPLIQPAPTAPDEWVSDEKVSSKPEAEIDLSASGETIAETQPEQEPQVSVPQAGSLSPVPAQDKDAMILTQAQDLLRSNQLGESMKEYSKLIRKGRLLDEVIHDLREAVYTFPVDIIVWQTLGDAYMRTNRLQDALDAYTKAEELLR